MNKTYHKCFQLVLSILITFLVFFFFQLEQFELIFEKLKLQTNVKDIDEFIELFVKQEDINKDLYKKSNELSDEVIKTALT